MNTASRHRRLAAAALLLSTLGALPGCPSEPLKNDDANAVLSACCSEARERIETARDVETENFRGQCASCKLGNSKGECESGAAKVQRTVRTAYGGDMMPTACVTMRAAMKPMGIELPDLR